MAEPLSVSRARLPLTAGREYLERAVVEVQVPERAGVLGFVAADLAALAAPNRLLFAGPALSRKPPLADQAVRLHVPPDRGIRAERSQRRIGLHTGGQIVIVQLVRPVLIVAILAKQVLGQSRRQGHSATVLAHGAAQDADRVVLLAPRGVVPAGTGGGREPDFASTHGMCPGLGGQGLEGRLQFSVGKRRTQQRTHDGKAEAGPQRGSRTIGIWNHHRSSRVQ